MRHEDALGHAMMGMLATLFATVVAWTNVSFAIPLHLMALPLVLRCNSSFADVATKHGAYCCLCALIGLLDPTLAPVQKRVLTGSTAYLLLYVITTSVNLILKHSGQTGLLPVPLSFSHGVIVATFVLRF